MPSWNIHTAHVERLLAEHRAEELGIDDANAFLFGSYVPDVYVGYMVPDTTFRIDYCLTHQAEPHVIPVPDSDRFWDECIEHPKRAPETPAGMSLALGAWAHLAADRIYNARFRSFCEERGLGHTDELRRRKQADFALFGRSLGISSHVEATPELLDAARRFRPYSILPADVERAVEAADAIVRAAGGPGAGGPDAPAGGYRLLSPEWMAAAFDACHEHVAARLLARRRDNGEPPR